VLLTPTSESQKSTGRAGPVDEGDAPVDGATLVVERPTAEAAIAEVHERLGADARILEARRVARGGIAGFFAREIVQIHAAPPETGAAAADGGSRTDAPTAAASAPATRTAFSSPPPPVAPGVDAAERSPIDRVLAGAEQTTDALDFATYLRQHLASGDLDPATLDSGMAASAASVEAPQAAATPGPADPAAAAPAAAVPAAAVPAAASPGPEPVRGVATAPEATPVQWPTVTVHDAGAPRRDETLSVPDGRPAWAEQVLAAATAELSATRHAVEAPESRITLEDAAPQVSAATPAAEEQAEEAAPGEPAEAPVGQAAVEGSRHRGPADEPPASTDGGPAWSVTTLIRMGLPSELVRSIEVPDPADDISWTYGLATALRPLCRPLPTGRCLVVGPRARGLAKAIGMATTAVGQPLRVRGDVAAQVGGGVDGLAWMEKVRKDRWIHLVAGGVGWRELLHSDPLAVSWASEEDLAEAIRCAVELGLVLGFGPLGIFAGRARPLDIALGIRDQVPWQ
jgi:hypothetical protein